MTALRYLQNYLLCSAISISIGLEPKELKRVNTVVVIRVLLELLVEGREQKPDIPWPAELGASLQDQSHI